MKKHGVDRFIEKEEAAMRCPNCGKKQYWYYRACPACHTPIRKKGDTRK